MAGCSQREWLHDTTAVYTGRVLPVLRQGSGLVRARCNVQLLVGAWPLQSNPSHCWLCRPAPARRRCRGPPPLQPVCRCTLGDFPSQERPCALPLGKLGCPQFQPLSQPSQATAKPPLGAQSRCTSASPCRAVCAQPLMPDVHVWQGLL